MTVDLSEILKRDEPLSGHTSFGIGGPARLFYEPRTEEQAVEVVRSCRRDGEPLFVLGGGTNLLVRDEGIDGAVVSLRKSSAIRFEGRRARVDAGASFPRLVSEGVTRGCGGADALVGIPGTVGGALVMNAGGRYGELCRFVERVRVVDREGVARTLSREEAGFGYRTSKLGEFVILGADLAFPEGDREAARARLREIIVEKSRTQPLAARSAGCVFKNPAPRIAAGRLIDEAGFKGKIIGGALVSPVHANFLVNRRGARASDILGLIREIKDRVRERNGVELELEIKIWPAPM